jgi:hypothetical protein
VLYVFSLWRYIHPLQDCFTGSILPGKAKGQTEMIGNLATYIAEPTGEVKNGVAVIYLCDGFGFGLINNKIIPGQLADALGCTVYVPDLLQGRFNIVIILWGPLWLINAFHLVGDYPPLDLHAIDQPISQKSLFHRTTQYLSLIWSFLYKIGPRWMIRHSRGKVQLLAEGQYLASLQHPFTEYRALRPKGFVKALKEEKQLSKIGVIG